MISPQTTRFPASRVASARGVVFPLGTGPQHGPGGLGDDGGQQVLLVPDADLPAAGTLLHGLLVLLHLLDGGLPLALDLLGAHPLDEGLLPLGHGALAGEFTWQATPNQAWMRPWSFSPVPRAASRS